MPSNIEIHRGFNGLRMICDEESFARIQSHILADPSVAEAAGKSSAGNGLRFILVSMPPVENIARGPGWPSLIPIMVAGGLFSVPVVVGYITLAQWFIRWIA